MKKIVRQNKTTRTLKKKYDVWEDRPRTESNICVPSSVAWNCSIDQLKDSKQILHIVLAENSAKVNFVFHENDDQDGDQFHDEIMRIEVNRQHYRFALIAKNYTGRPMPNKFVAVFFANGCHQTPCKSLIFTREDEKQFWTQPQEHNHPSEPNASEVFRNAFLVATKHGDCLLIFRDEHAILYNETMEPITKVNYQNERC